MEYKFYLHLDETEVAARLDAHQRWLVSGGREGEQASFASCHVKFDFVGRNLENIDFGDADLKGSVFSDCQIRHCSFEGASLDDVIFIRCDINEHTSFKDVTARGLFIHESLISDSSMQGMVTDNLRMDSNTIRKLDMSRMIFRCPQFADNRFMLSNLSHIEMSQGSFFGNNGFKTCSFAGSHSYLTDYGNTYFADVSFHKGLISRSYLNKVILDNCQAAELQLDNSNIERARLLNSTKLPYELHVTRLYLHNTPATVGLNTGTGRFTSELLLGRCVSMDLKQFTAAILFGKLHVQTNKKDKALLLAGSAYLYKIYSDKKNIVK